jgi:hypothetical protein
MFHVLIINGDFHSAYEADADDLEAARTQGLKGALEIGTEEVCNGTSFFGAEVRIESDGEVCERMLIAIGASPLK